MIQVAVLWAINEQDEVLLAQRSHTKPQDPGVWGPTVTGKLEPGETFEQALYREVKEELGLAPDQYQPELLFERDFMHPDGEPRKFCFYYARLPHDITNRLHIDAVEVAGVAWVDRMEALHRIKTEPETLVPSAASTWPDIMQALDPARMTG